MLSVRSRSFVNGEILARLSRPMMVGSSRNASYSKNPQMKDGSLRALIYNDAKHRGKQHLLRDEFNPNRLGKPEVPASWVSAKMAFILGVTGKLLGKHKADLQQISGLLIEP